MKPIRTFIHQNGIKLVLNAEKPLYDLTKGKLGHNRFLSSVDVENIGTSVKIVKETNNATYIAKYNEDGTIDNGDFKILLTTDMHLDEDYDLNDKTFDRIYKQIRDNKPDLVIFGGDNVSSGFNKKRNNEFAQLMENLVVKVFTGNIIRSFYGWMDGIISSSIILILHM